MPSQFAAPESARLLNFEPWRFSHNLPPDVRQKLKEIFAHWQDEPRAEALVQEILEQSPDSLGIRIVAYRFYFYRRRSREAAAWALRCLDWLSVQLGLPARWQEVTADMADFAHWHAYTRLWLQSLTAYAYNMARLGELDEALAALAQVERLDAEGKLGAGHLREVFAGPRGDAGMVFAKHDEHANAADPATPV